MAALGGLRREEMQQWLIGVVVSLFIVTVSAGVAQLGGDGGQQFRGLPVFVWCGIFAFAVQWILFIHAWSIRSEKYFDLAGSLTYVTVCLLYTSPSPRDATLSRMPSSA